MSVISKPVPKPAESQTFRLMFQRWWDALTKPSDLIREPDKRLQARVVSALMGFSLLFIIIVVGLPLVSSPGTSTAATQVIDLVIVVVTLSMYVISRTERSQLAMALFLGATTVELFAAYAATPANIVPFDYLVFPVLLAGYFLSIQMASFLVGTIIVGMFVVPHLVPTTVDPSAATDFVILIAGITLILVQFRNTLENARKNQITSALKEVETLNGTLEKTNQELLAASALAKESVRLKSEFMATMSHELRTPLNAMLGFSGILLEGIGGEFDADTRYMIERIQQNSERLLTLINSVLDIAKIEAGRLDLVSVPINPRKLVDGWYGQMSVLAEKKNLTFTTEVDSTLPEFYGDAERISQIAVNLLSNAFKFTEAGSVTLAMINKGDSWQIQVTDSGIGIPPHALNYIFDEFRQLDGTSKRAYGGTGLGLAIVRNLCRMMEGTVQVTSKLGEGSVFTVTLPLKPVEITESAPIAEVSLP